MAKGKGKYGKKSKNITLEEEATTVHKERCGHKRKKSVPARVDSVAFKAQKIIWSRYIRCTNHSKV
jgi:hypothetical protein